MKQLSSLSVVVPVYRSAESLPELVSVLAEVLPSVATTFELLLVDDSSPDQSWQVINDLATQYPWVRGLRLMRNYGQHNALLCGIRAAKSEFITTMDDDLQHPPQELLKLREALADNVDVVYGAPQQEQHGIMRDFASQITKLMLQSSMGVDTARHVSAFRLFRTELRRAFETYSSPYVNIDVLLTWATTKFVVVHVRHDERKYGESTYTLRKLVRHALNMITGFSILPLRIASLIGFMFTIFGVLVLFYVVGQALIQGIVVQGFPFLASIIAIFAGAQLFALGIIGEYLARIHFRIMDRPVYTIRTETTTDTTA